MTATFKPTTLEQFIAFANLPENRNRAFEFINGEVVEVSPSRTRNSKIALRLARYVLNYCEAHNLPDNASGSDGAYLILESVVAPDFAYKITAMSDDYPDLEPPLLAVEVISPSETAADIRDKREIYAAAGILYWEIYPKRKQIDVYEPGKPPRTLGINDTLDGGSVLPGFTLELTKLFAV